ncbi:L-histidine N(alpha)-methyltransferase [Puia dinghuensis]|uniref:Dimethylhistidine N-methyltransferase n=1 Tax=Puia dinghuensis TaxID=1792502 RepID=A0A8J2XS75_9BACT|nr:L-histidine N(alpha)-methyltransferase [Puia dinghuensis]GGB06892.1 dimethylhistidine N-methyltransferase [Puia dinghuensis]
MFPLSTAQLPGRRSATFYTDVVNGLRADHKYLSSKYFYDENGDKLFQQIMACPEYYPTRCELEIMQHQSGKMARLFMEESSDFDLVELGPGDATKSWFLLRELQKDHASFTYYPIDISSNVIGWLEDKLPVTLPGIRLQGLNGEYLEQLHQVNTFSNKRKIVLFMGANIGNMTVHQATQFCRQLHEQMHPGDLLMIGFDLKKYPGTILAAYNDKQGITRAFNLNLLTRINRELGADFDVEQFEHYPVYDPGTGSCKSYLISRIQQEVHIGDNQFSFAENEVIHMEISQKYTLMETESMAAQAGFEPVDTFFDSKRWFADVLWRRLA